MKYVVAVSGGVDSMALLDMLVNSRCENLTVETKNLIVAHFDHGIREDSVTDEKFVRGVVGEYGISYESAREDLGPNTSEEKAREARYNFLLQCCKKYNAQLITAHHQDDLVETMIINMIRGTGWRGLAPMSQILDEQPETTNQQILRPLLATSKSEILEYAKKYTIAWREDSTNTSREYLRNYIRLQLIPAMVKKDPAATLQLLQINAELQRIKKEIATELQKIIPHKLHNTIMPRHPFIMWPSPVAAEVLYVVLTQLDVDWHPTSRQISRVLHFIKSGKPHKVFELSRIVKIVLTTKTVQFKSR
jgi:tRNA(Ile)-lysidine synthase